jgi:hypothetical protein
MALVTTYICDVCGAPRREANHWYVIQNAGIGFLLKPFEKMADQGTHLCGEACVLKKISELIGGKQAQ